MESLAAVVAVIVFATIGLGPVAILFSRSSRRGFQIAGGVLAGVGLIAGFRMLTSVDSMGAQVVWAFCTITCGYALWTVIRKFRNQ